MRCFLLVAIVIYSSNCVAQVLFKQETIHGGILSIGANYGLGAGTVKFPIDLPANSQIVQAHLFAKEDDDETPVVIGLNNHTFVLDSSKRISAPFASAQLSFSSYIGHINYVDVLSYITPGIDTLKFSVTLNQNDNFYAIYESYYLHLIFENPNLPKLNYAIYYNDKDVNWNLHCNLNNINPIDTSKDVGFAFQGGHFVEWSFDSSDVYVNGFHLGAVNGQDNLGINPGTTGNLLYYNDTLFAYDDDTPDSLMHGADALANIQSYLPNNTTSIDVDFNYQLQHNATGGLSNPINHIVLAYTTPCDTFTVNLQDSYTVCKGDSVQLQLSGGIDWEWEATSANPNTGLSCYNCASPWFKDTVSRWYTVRVWNNDSCSKVLPVHINVVDNPLPPALQVNTTNCSDSTGSIAVQVQNPTHSYSIDGNLPQSSPMFSNLHAGAYQITIIDTNGCSSSTNALVNQVYPMAQFIANPQQGNVPLNVQFTNQSTGATNYIWYIASDTLTTVNPSYLFTNAGSFSTTLIAYDTYPQCADTSSLQIYTEHPFVVIAPSIHLKGNAYEIYTSGVSSLEYQLYNAIGQLVKQKNFIPANGNNFMWSANNLSRGIYVYRITAKDADGNKKEYKGKVVLQ